MKTRKTRATRALGALAGLALLIGGTTAQAAATVTAMTDTSATSAASLVDALLGSGSGLTVVAGSSSYTGAAAASGTFANGGTGPSGLGLASGVVLTTGDARFIGSSAAFPGDDANKSITFTAGIDNTLTPNTSPGNSLFAGLTSEPTFNASILSFGFVPTQAFLSLSFVFGSEDYSDLVNSGFPTDVFGIFVNGVNYALVPGTNTPISASTVNCGGPSSGAASGAGGSNCGLYRDNPSFSGLIDSELDGFTVPLTLNIPVNVGVANVMRIGIADTFDSSGDSALMLRVNAVSAIPEPSTYALMLGGLALTAGIASRRRRAASKPESDRR